ncbi:hypothetical protein CIB48_g8635 [Xylaria polymorpha]|nr:hypothetical protein CIB48_g8635 [Xylaria polymorpha]
MPCTGCDALPPSYAFRLALVGSDGSHNKELCVTCSNESASKDDKKSPSSKSCGKRPTKHKWVSWELQLNGELVVRT